MPTWRLHALLLIAAPIGAFGGPAVLLSLALVLLALVAAAVDWYLARDIRDVSAQRILQTDKLSLGDWNPVRLELTSNAQRVHHIEVRDLPPIDFKLDTYAPMFRATVRPGASATMTYRVRPPRRGDATFGDLYIRTLGPLRLMHRQRRLSGSAQHVRIYPSLRELRRFDLLVRRGLEAQPVGRPVRRPGASTEFERIREYVAGDEFRRVNWKATARRGQPMVNQFEAERGQNLVIMLDAGRAMAALAEEPATDELQADAGPILTKLDYALNAGLLLAYAASRWGDRVAIEAYT
ncbi:MAG: DUF58 domain-containing protein, partial [Chloroflexi bacterium]|nr:DUF58 domain-containing protein [Chloroflexota bacterium]